MSREVLLATECLVAAIFSALEWAMTRMQLYVLREMFLLLELTLAGGTGMSIG